MAHFSLRNLLIYVFACCVWLAALQGMRTMSHNGYFSPNGIAVISLVLGWLLLSIVYYLWRLRSGLIVHCWGPSALVGVVLIAAVNSDLPDICLDALVVRTLALGCWLGIVFSFPTTTLIILAIERSRFEPVTSSSSNLEMRTHRN